MEIKIKSYSNKSSLVSSIIFFIIGAILTAYSERIMSATYRIVGVALLITSICIVISMVIRKKRQQPIFINRIAMAIISFTLAILFFFFHNVIDETIRFIVGAWILFSGITRLISALRTDRHASRFIAILIVSLLLILLGIYTIIKNGIVLWVIGIIIMIYSAIEIVGFIFYSKDNINYDDEDAEEESKLLVPEKEDKKERKLLKGKVKDVKEEDIEEK